MTFLNMAPPQKLVLASGAILRGNTVFINTIETTIACHKMNPCRALIVYVVTEGNIRQSKVRSLLAAFRQK